jgi:hypothetical protein
LSTSTAAAAVTTTEKTKDQSIYHLYSVLQKFPGKKKWLRETPSLFRKGSRRRSESTLRGHSTTTLSKSYPILTPSSPWLGNYGYFTWYLLFVTCPSIDFPLTPIPFSCPRSSWMTPKTNYLNSTKPRACTTNLVHLLGLKCLSIFALKGHLFEICVELYSDSLFQATLCNICSISKYELKSVHTRSSFLSKSVVIFTDFVLISATLFERNEDRVSGFLKWTDFSLILQNKSNFLCAELKWNFLKCA